jgi:hypothetical protein
VYPNLFGGHQTHTQCLGIMGSKGHRNVMFLEKDGCKLLEGTLISTQGFCAIRKKLELLEELSLVEES